MIESLLPPVAGGLMIGLAASGLLFLIGRIAGISGILWAALSGAAGSAWRWLFLAGMLAGTGIYHLVTGAAIPAAPSSSLVYAISGGLLVGFGTRLGSGCTSGHGVCGIGRLSARSITATITFMTTGIVTVYVLRHVLELT